MEGNKSNIVDEENTQGNDNSNRSYCQYCRHKVHATRNTTGICVKCKKRKYDDFSEFSFDEGTERALKGSNFNKQQQIQYTKLSNSQPMKIEVFQQNTTGEVSTHCLLSNESALYLSKNIPFKNDIQSGTFYGRISFSREESGSISNDCHNVLKNNNNDTILQMTARASRTPNVINKLGPYNKLDEKTKKILNFDFRAKPQLLMLIPLLFSGAIIQDNNLSLVILSCEVYYRSNNVDIHSEPTEYSIPAEGEITCSVHTKSDGGKEIQKLIIGGSFLNLLIVSSVEISNNPKVHVGPGVDFGHCRISETCNIFVRSICQEQLINQFDSNETIPLTINNLRQLTTHFGKKSTYNPWRSSLNEFNTTLNMPATATTLCSLPSSGYGFGPDSLSFISSQLLQLFSIAVIYNKCVIKNNELESFFMDHSLVLKKKSPKDWDYLVKIVKKLKEELEKTEEINVLEFCQENSISTIAKGLSGALSTANTLIEKNVKNKFLSLYK